MQALPQSVTPITPSAYFRPISLRRNGGLIEGTVVLLVARLVEVEGNEEIRRLLLFQL
jgi:hypothetical protein